MEHESILLEAEGLVHGQRGEDYGHPLDDFTRTAKIWSAILGIEVSAEQAILCMIGLKVSRECNKGKRDNTTDSAGYSEALEMCKHERQRRKKDAEENITYSVPGLNRVHMD